MLSSAKISICIPAYNASKYLGETLQTVKMQTYKEWELIVVEDGTSDGTEEIVKEFRKSVTQNVLYHNQKNNLGVSATRNAAVALSNGEWIAFLDSDDLWEPEHLADLIYESVKDPESQLIHSEVSVFDSLTKNKLDSPALSQMTIDELPLSLFDGRYPTQPSAVMVSSKLFKLIGGFNTDMAIQGCEDKDLWFRFARAGYKFAFTGKFTSHYRKHFEALSANSGRMAAAMAHVYSMHFDWHAIPKRIRVTHAADAWLSAARLIRASNKRLAKEYLSKSLKYQASIQQIIFWMVLRIL